MSTTTTMPASSANCHCYGCDHDYGFLGDEPHPGVCPSCGSRAVSFSGRVAIVEPDADPAEEMDLDLTNVLRLHGRDDTDRHLSWHVDLIGTRAKPTLRHVTLDGERINVGDEGRSAELIPECVQDVVREETGEDLVVPRVDGGGL